MADAPARTPLRRSLVVTIVKLSISLALLALLLSRVEAVRLWTRARAVIVPLSRILRLSLFATAPIMLFSLSGAAVYVSRRH